MTSQVGAHLSRVVVRASVSGVYTYALDGVGAGGPAQHRDSGVLLVGVHLQSHLIGGQAESGNHLTDAA